MRLVQSPDKKKKLRAIFDDGTHTDFGARGYGDFTIYSAKNPKTAELHKEQYLKRHKIREDWNDYKSAGALSRWVLWNKPTVEESFEDYKNRFNL